MSIKDYQPAVACRISGCNILISHPITDMIACECAKTMTVSQSHHSIVIAYGTETGHYQCPHRHLPHLDDLDRL